MNARHALSLTALLVSSSAQAGVVTLVADRDATLFESSTGCCASGAGAHLFAGDLSNGNINRTLLHFDVASAVPAGSTIVAVRLDLELTRSRAGNENMTLHRVLADWGEGASDSGAPGQTLAGLGAPALPGDATWQLRFFPNTPWTNPGGDFDFTATATVLMGGASGIGVQSLSSPGMASDVQDWLDDPSSNFGWMLRAEDEFVTRSARRFASREAGNPAIAPRIEIEFTGPVGASYCVAAVNSTGGAASLSAEGCLVAAQQSLTLRASDLPPGVPGLFFHSPTQAQTPFGDGFLCVGGQATRLWPPGFADAGGVLEHAVDFGRPSASAIVAGASLNFQGWYRDPAAALSGHNTSDALHIAFQ